MIDHVKIKVSNLDKSRKFYGEVLAILGYKVAFEFGKTMTAYSLGRGYLFEIAQSKSKVATTTHVCFRVKSKDMVKKFHAAGLKAGGKDNGKPGLRPQYEPNYYAAFILDPDGHNIETVFYT